MVKSSLASPGRCVEDESIGKEHTGPGICDGEGTWGTSGGEFGEKRSFVDFFF